MLARAEDVLDESPLPTDSEQTPKKRRRIPRACDRCRLKKSKCDGAKVCKTCQTTDSTCLYRTRRNREAKNYYWYMRDITDEALVRLYWACQNGTGFPGHEVKETDGQVTTHAILEGLGLTGPIEDKPTFKDKRSNPTRPTYPLQALRRECPTPPLTPDELESTTATTAPNTNNVSSRTSSTASTDMSHTSKDTILQHQYQSQAQPEMQPQVESYSIDASSYIYATTYQPLKDSPHTDHQPQLAKCPSFELPATMAPMPAISASVPMLHASNGMMTSQFFDFDTAGITPNMLMANFDFSQHDYLANFPT